MLEEVDVDMDLIINSRQTLTYTSADISLPGGQYMVKVVTERGNTAIHSGGYHRL